MRARLFCLLLSAAAAGAAEPVAPKKPPVVANKDCMDCHEAEFKPRKRGLPPEWIGVRPELYAKSVHGTVNCVDCHVDATWRQDGRVHGRNTPSLVDVTRQAVFGWDGASNDLATMVRTELTRRHGLADAAALQRAVAADAELAAAAAQAFPSGVDLVGASDALVLHLDAGRSTTNWDRYVDGDDEALSPAARAGLATFLEVGCATCHRGRSLGGGSLHKLGLAVPYPSTDPGRMGVTGKPEDAQVFRAPMLRSAARTPPYLHDGSIPTLREAVVVMARHELGKELSPSKLDGLVTFLEELRPVGRAGP